MSNSKVIVDVREFRSSLPSLLHAAGECVCVVRNLESRGSKGKKGRGNLRKGEKSKESERRGQLMDRRRETGEGKSRSLRKIGWAHNVPIVLSFSFQYLTLPLFLPPFHFLST